MSHFVHPNGLGDFGGTHGQIKAWQYANGVILHTLKPGWTWPSETNPAADQYDLDRVLVFGGGPKVIEPRTSTNDPLRAANLPAHSIVLELQGASSLPPSQWTWREKAHASSGRMTGNWVVLPDGKILAVGGGSRTISAPEFFLSTTECFEPKGPTDLGNWSPMQSRVAVPVGGDFRVTPRVYHSVALLLPSGEVALMGGFAVNNYPDSAHTAEVFKPTYTHYTNRPSLANVPAEVNYPDGVNSGVFCVQTNSSQVLRACLIGVGSVTHHFDYGQRYVELMVRQTACANGNVEVYPPLSGAVAPPGHYMLFLVDWRGIPSAGALVKVDYKRP